MENIVLILKVAVQAVHLAMNHGTCTTARNNDSNNRTPGKCTDRRSITKINTKGKTKAERGAAAAAVKKVVTAAATAAAAATKAATDALVLHQALLLRIRGRSTSQSHTMYTNLIGNNNKSNPNTESSRAAAVLAAAVLAAAAAVLAAAAVAVPATAKEEAAGGITAVQTSSRVLPQWMYSATASSQHINRRHLGVKVQHQGSNFLLAAVPAAVPAAAAAAVPAAAAAAPATVAAAAAAAALPVASHPNRFNS
ncbi:antifreeze protein Maxi-like [Protopterus annectens]|uniref:antifreeze protein Maxi-like n=1 Tax=Protopterus annectens TaxID=7888 RepID=UPI001CFB447D|nr:antifreeze protein Maxi-like [Protopterus annectens]